MDANHVGSQSTDDLNKIDQHQDLVDYPIDGPHPTQSKVPPTAGNSRFFGGLHGSRYNFNRLVNHYGPLFTKLDFVISLYQWKNKPVYSWLLLVGFWVFCLFPKLSVVGGPHLLILSWIGYKYYLKYHDQNHVSPSKLKRKVYDLQNILQKLTLIDLFISVQLGRLDWSNPTETSRIIKYVLFSYPLWAVTSSVVPLNLLCLMGGTTVLLWHHPYVATLRKPFTDDSPLFQSVIHAILTPVEDEAVLAAKKRGLPLRKLTAESKLINEKTLELMSRPRNEPPTLKVVESDIFQDTDGATVFQLFEHQRKWPALGWTTRMMGSDPYPWTDEMNKFVEHPKDFEPPVVSSVVNKLGSDEGKAVFLQTKVCWRWIDDDWSPAITAETDAEGWEYGGRKFEAYCARSGTTRMTRRRRWCRKAIKITRREKLMDYLPEVIEFDPLNAD
ncbi:hypothetical protein K493DRAFT_404805 [Basidiobolus meristosporus CBS 931.73]|uniref:TECPR1-like DysF domain-containing protein n=1 Tax=Basidiobolus meristosporus CBS 931.73 TaxID=1314790 RepID=A0A1Y1Z1C2_9FUNG|nr:hypothetical protein K493DRAFT_404805 [Basidiobolus meristosporus CBS 931.73]|eukprot:ORY04093.1 hypothetical protein K493DRAFT_404805 [Basidiobolus meristosporus CBS 931.73]